MKLKAEDLRLTNLLSKASEESVNTEKKGSDTQIFLGSLHLHLEPKTACELSTADESNPNGRCFEFF